MLSSAAGALAHLEALWRPHDRPAPADCVPSGRVLSPAHSVTMTSMSTSGAFATARQAETSCHESHRSYLWTRLASTASAVTAMISTVTR